MTLFGRSVPTSPHFFKFAFVGAFGTLLNLLLMALQVELFAADPVSASIAAIEISIIHNFLLNNFWTFGSRRPGSSLLKRLLHFNLIALGSMIANVAVAAMLIRFGAWYLLAQAVGIASAWAINYLVSTRLVFKSANI